MEDDWTLPQKKPLTPEQKQKRLKNKVKRGAHITATTLAHELHITPRAMRAALRALKVKKPSHGWAWPKGEAAAIKARVAKRLKKPLTSPSEEITSLPVNATGENDGTEERNIIRLPPSLGRPSGDGREGNDGQGHNEEGGPELDGDEGTSDRKWSTGT